MKEILEGMVSKRFFIFFKVVNLDMVFGFTRDF